MFDALRAAVAEVKSGAAVARIVYNAERNDGVVMSVYPHPITGVKIAMTHRFMYAGDERCDLHTGRYDITLDEARGDLNYRGSFV